MNTFDSDKPGFRPFWHLETARLNLRPLNASDLEEIYILRSNTEVNRFLSRPLAASKKDAMNFIEMIGEGTAINKWAYWAIEVRGMQTLAGTICLFNLDSDGRRAEIGFELLPDFQGRGIMLEAAQEVIQLGFKNLGLEHIFALVKPGNTRSIHLLEKLDFKRKNEPGNCLKDEEGMNCYVLPANDWKRR